MPDLRLGSRPLRPGPSNKFGKSGFGHRTNTSSLLLEHEVSSATCKCSIALRKTRVACVLIHSVHVRSDLLKLIGRSVGLLLNSELAFLRLPAFASQRSELSATDSCHTIFPEL